MTNLIDTWPADADLGALHTGFHTLVANVERQVHGKPDQVRLAACCLFAEGHLLVEDVPGVGKTSLARALAASIGGRSARIQFTPDLMPSDITGVTVYDQSTGRFVFHRGPVFAHVLVADEVNRAAPKTQSALLEVMAERQVTVDGRAERLARPFIVVATQNPIDMDGTYPLPEAQLDRFLIRVRMGYPPEDAELTVLAAHRRTGNTGPAVDAMLPPVLSPEEVGRLADAARAVHVSDGLARYIIRIAAATRDRGIGASLGVSPRGAVALQRAAQVWAAAAGRDFVQADDVVDLAVPVFAHRLVLTPEADLAGASAEDVVTRAVSTVAAPRRRAAV